MSDVHHAKQCRNYSSIGDPFCEYWIGETSLTLLAYQGRNERRGRSSISAAAFSQTDLLPGHRTHPHDRIRMSIKMSTSFGESCVFPRLVRKIYDFKACPQHLNPGLSWSRSQALSPLSFRSRLFQDEIGDLRGLMPTWITSRDRDEAQSDELDVPRPAVEMHNTTSLTPPCTTQTTSMENADYLRLGNLVKPRPPSIRRNVVPL